MAAILDLFLHQKVETGVLVPWLRDQLLEIPECLSEFTKQEKLEFVPYFLNFLRDQSTPLLQSSNQPSPSPVTTPIQSGKKPNLTQNRDSDGRITPRDSRRRSGNRVQLFAASPMERSDTDFLASPNTSLDSISDQRTVKWTNDYGNKSRSATPEHGSRRQTLGDYLPTPERGSNKKKSPHWLKDSPSENQNRSRKSFERTTPVLQSSPKFSLCEDDFPPMGADSGRKSASPRNTPELQSTPKSASGSSRKKPTRRITPTPLNQRRANQSPLASTTDSGKSFSVQSVNPAFRESNKSFTEQTINPAFRDSEPVTPATPKSVLQDRELMKIDLMKRRLGGASSPCSPLDINSNSKMENSITSLQTTPTKALLLKSAPTVIVNAEMAKVTRNEKMDILVELYSGLFQNWLISNIVVELYFLVQLLTVRGATDSDVVLEALNDDGILYFDTVHNMVYFAVNVLNKQREILHNLDRGFIRLLCDNPRISAFSTEFTDFLIAMYDSSSTRQISAPEALPFGGISFQVEMDTKTNFPDDNTFHVFKKQRDTFYEILREWENRHHDADWSIENNVAHKIRMLLNGFQHIYNYIRFVDLFLNQLMKMCKGDDTWKQEDTTNETDLLAHLRSKNPEKFKKLKDRFTMQTSSGLGPSPAPNFTGCQAFFKSFITISSNSVFNQHLVDALVQRIQDLDCVTFNADELDLEEDRQEKESRDNLISTMLSLRILGKFLGFVHHIPYQTPSKLPDRMIEELILSRATMRQPLDLQCFLKRSIEKGRTLVTLPWIVEYLSMADSITLRLDYFKTILDTLLQFYRQITAEFSAQKTTTQNLNQLLLIVLLGWLFETPAFPEGLMFSENTTPSELKLTLDGLDAKPIVDHRTLFICCPFLSELKPLLVEFSLGMSARNNKMRKITPVSADTKIETTQISTAPKLQLQLEEYFFNNHPASMKRCVEFVADRIASNYIKKFRANDFVQLVEEGRSSVSILTKNCAKGGYDQKEKAKMQVALLNECANLARKAQDCLLAKREDYCEKSVGSVLKQLLPEEISAGVLQVATGIAVRISVQKVDDWSKTHLTPTIFSTQLLVDLDKKVKAKTFVRLHEEERTPQEAAIENGTKESTEKEEKSMKFVTENEEKSPKCTENEGKTLKPSLKNEESRKSSPENAEKLLEATSENKESSIESATEKEGKSHKLTVENAASQNSTLENGVELQKSTARNEELKTNKKKKKNKKKSRTVTENAEDSYCATENRETVKIEPKVQNSQGEKPAHLPIGEVKPPSDLLCDLRDIMRLIANNELGQTTEVERFVADRELIENVLSDIAISLENRADIIPVIYKCLAQATTELVFLTLCHNANYFNNVSCAVLRLWHGCLKTHVLAHQFLSAKVFCQISDTQDKRIFDSRWWSYFRYYTLVRKVEVFDYQEFDQCLLNALKREKYSSAVMEKIALVVYTSMCVPDMDLAQTVFSRERAEIYNEILTILEPFRAKIPDAKSFLHQTCEEGRKALQAATSK